MVVIPFHFIVMSLPFLWCFDWFEVLWKLTIDLLISRVSFHYHSSLPFTVGWIVLHCHDSTGFRTRNTYSRTDITDKFSKYVRAEFEVWQEMLSLCKFPTRQEPYSGNGWICMTLDTLNLGFSSGRLHEDGWLQLKQLLNEHINEHLVFTGSITQTVTNKQSGSHHYLLYKSVAGGQVVHFKTPRMHLTGFVFHGHLADATLHALGFMMVSPMPCAWWNRWPILHHPHACTH